MTDSGIARQARVDSRKLVKAVKVGVCLHGDTFRVRLTEQLPDARLDAALRAEHRPVRVVTLQIRRQRFRLREPRALALARAQAYA